LIREVISAAKICPLAVITNFATFQDVTKELLQVRKNHSILQDDGTSLFKIVHHPLHEGDDCGKKEVDHGTLCYGSNGGEVSKRVETVPVVVGDSNRICQLTRYRGWKIGCMAIFSRRSVYRTVTANHYSLESPRPMAASLWSSSHCNPYYDTVNSTAVIKRWIDALLSSDGDNEVDEFKQQSRRSSERTPKDTIILILDHITKAENIGSIFKLANKFGVAGVILATGCCDPLYRRVVYESRKQTWYLPHLVLSNERDYDTVMSELKVKGIGITALSLSDPSNGTVMTPNQILCDYEKGRKERRREERGKMYQQHIGRENSKSNIVDGIALVLGNEHRGLPRRIIDRVDKTVKIPISDAIDSLNVAMSLSVMLYKLHQLVSR